MGHSFLQSLPLYFGIMFIVKLLFTLQRKRERVATLGRGKFLLYCSLEASIEATIFAFMMFAFFFMDENDLMIGDFDFNLMTYLAVIGGAVAVGMILRNLPYIRDALANLEGPPKAAKSE
jgi:hypothetical protein